MSNHEEHSWNLSRLQSLIADRIEENYRLEYKAAGAIDDSDKGKVEITKDVSAFANSDGGTIIYGISEHKEKELSHLPEKIDPVSRKRFSKEWLEHIIANIRPAIPDLRIIPIQCSATDDEVAYVVEIPKSTTAHQAKDCRYYKRYNFESKMMLDYEIRDVMNRIQHPKVSAKAKFSTQEYGTEACLHFEVCNESDVMARHFAAIIHMPINWGTTGLVPEGDAVVVEVDGMSSLRMAFSNAGGAPLFPKSTMYHNFKFKFGRWEAKGGGELKPTLKEIRFKVYADSSPAVEGSFTIDSILQDTS